jgi:hypothetical protein
MKIINYDVFVKIINFIVDNQGIQVCTYLLVFLSCRNLLFLLFQNIFLTTLLMNKKTN